MENEFEKSELEIETPKQILPSWRDFLDDMPILKTQQDFIDTIGIGKAIIKQDAEAGLEQSEVDTRYEFIQEIIRNAYAKKIQV